MKTALVTHPACLEHDTGPGHPERADRLRAVLRALEGDEFSGLLREIAPQATVEQIARAHSEDYAAARRNARISASSMACRCRSS